MRRIKLGSALNCRDLGGYTTSCGKPTKFLRFLRCDAPLGFSEEDIKFLQVNKITTSVDLRSIREIKEFPSSMNREDFNYHSVPIYGGNIIPEAEDKINHFYFAMADEKKTVYQALKTLADAKDGAIFNCSAGKDRTGIIASLLLFNAGVDFDDILADYQVSYSYIRSFIEVWKRDYPDFPAFMGLSKMEYLIGFYEILNEKYGSPEGYMRAIGLSDCDLETLRAKLIE